MKFIDSVKNALGLAKTKKQKVIARLLESGHITVDDACLLLSDNVEINIDKVDVSSGAIISGGDAIRDVGR